MIRSFLTFVLGILILFLSVPGRSQQPPVNPILVKARTAQLIVEVVGPRSQQQSFHAETSRILKLADETKLWVHFRYTRGPNADIIIKIQENQTLVNYHKITLTVFNPEDNEELYSEIRNLVDVENDVSRLISHFLSDVAQEKELAKQAEKKSAQVDIKGNIRVGDVVWAVTCDSAKLYENHEDPRRITKILHKNEPVILLMPVGNECIVRAGNSVGYVASECLEDQDASAGAPEEGLVQVNSNPPGARIFVDGVLTEYLTPSQVRLFSGTHTLTISLPAYHRARPKVEVTKGSTATVNQTLLPEDNPKR